MGADSGLELKVYELSHFNIDIYQENKVAIRKINLPDDIQQCTKVNLKGTEYIKGHALVIRQDGYEENITIGRICLLLCSIEMQVYAVFEVIEFFYTISSSLWTGTNNWLGMPFFAWSNGFQTNAHIQFRKYAVY